MPLAVPTSFDDYFSGFPPEHREMMQILRETIQTAVPDATEVISYKMPAFEYHGILVWFGAFSRHIGFYPRVSAMVAFQKELQPYKTSKGAVQFPLSHPLPVELVKAMVGFRVAENSIRAK